MTKQADRWRIPKYDIADAAAIQALVKGAATPEQQKRALDWIVVKAAQTYEMPFDLESDRVSAFYAGRMFVGQQIVKMMKMPLDVFREKGNDHD